MEKAGAANKVFLRNMSLLLVVNLIIKPIYILFIDAQVQNQIGENAYGAYFEILNFCLLFQIILDPGILNYNSQLISKDPQNAQEHFKVIAAGKLILTLFFALIVIGFSFLMHYPTGYYQVLPWVALILVLTTFSQYLRSHFAALGKYHFEVWLSGLDKFLMILLVGYYLYVRQEIDIQVFIYCQLIVFAFMVILFLYLLSKSFKLELRFSMKELRALILKTYPYALVLFLMSIYTRLDGVMLGRLLDDQAYSAGLYARSYRLLDAANMIGILFASLMLPMFSKLIKNREELNKLVEEVTRWLFVICLIVVAVCWYYGPEIMNLIYTNNTEEHIRVFRFLMLGYFAMGLSNIYGCLFLASEKLKKVNMIFLLGIVVNLSLNFSLIPEYKAFGAVIATLITQALVFTGQLVLALKEFEIRYNTKTITGILLIFLLTIISFEVFKVEQSLSWMIELTLAIIFILLLSFLSGFLRFSLIFAKEKA